MKSEPRHVRALSNGIELEPQKYGSIESDEKATKTASNQKNNLERGDLTRDEYSKVAMTCMVFFAIVFILSSKQNNTSEFHLKQKQTTVALHPAEHFFSEAIVDHNDPHSSGNFRQRYFENKENFGGPGSPIFVMVGGEDEIGGDLYPFIDAYLGRNHSAYSVYIEHRFYGKSFPVPNPTIDDLHRLLSPAQAMQDIVRLIQFKQAELGCGPRGTESYCPVLTVGGSYPGFLAGLMRLVHGDVVDIGYGSSAPFNLYWHQNMDSGAYFEKITDVAEEMSPGCATAVKETLLSMKTDCSDTSDVPKLALDYGVCIHSVPSYIRSGEVFAEEVLEVIATHFAEYDMFYYPPDTSNEFYQACQLFQDESKSTSEKVKEFLTMRMDNCFDLMTELPPGPEGTISGSDWSGVDGGSSGLMWDFQCCYLNPQAGFSSKSMFPEREWTLEWQTDHCERRFGLTPNLSAIAEDLGVSDLTGATRLLLTNGMRDGWAAVSILQSNEPGVKVINLPNGAHHSDLLIGHPLEDDTQDIKDAHAEISALVGKWIKDIKVEHLG